MGKFDNIKKVKESAYMKESKKEKLEKKKKIINIPTKWEEEIKKAYPGSVSSYILMAIQEKMKRDGLI